MQGYVIVKCSLCDYEYKMDWSDVLVGEEAGLKLGDHILFLHMCPQCKAMRQGKIIEDINGRRLK